MGTVKNTQKKNTLRGFTLIEAIVAIGIVSVIALGMVIFQITVMRTTATVQSGLLSQQQIRKTFAQFTKEVRSAVQAPTGAPAIFQAGTSSLIFYANVDADVDVERIQYYLGTTSPSASTTLYKRIINPVAGVYSNTNSLVSIMVDKIKVSTSTPIFYYYDSNYTGTTSALAQPVTVTAVRTVKLSLPVDPNAARSPIFQVYTTQVSLRNLKDNL